jgi:hypothetical protein
MAIFEQKTVYFWQKANFYQKNSYWGIFLLTFVWVDDRKIFLCHTFVI